jgi:hypothetical protein
MVPRESLPRCWPPGEQRRWAKDPRAQGSNACASRLGSSEVAVSDVRGRTVRCPVKLLVRVPIAGDCNSMCQSTSAVIQFQHLRLERMEARRKGCARRRMVAVW